jgi:hypothetical protein
MNFQNSSFNYIDPMRQSANFINPNNSYGSITPMMKFDRNDFQFSNMGSFNRITQIQQDSSRLPGEKIPIDARRFNQNFEYYSGNSDEEGKERNKNDEDLLKIPYSSIMRQKMVTSVLLDNNDSEIRQIRNSGFTSLREDPNPMFRFADNNQYERGSKHYMTSNKYN